MRESRNPIRCSAVALAVATVCLVWLTGCVSISPESVKAKPQSVSPTWSGAVNVAAVQTGEGLTEANLNGQLVEIDLDGFSDTLAGLVRDSLAETGVAAQAGAPVIEIRVVRLDFMFQSPCLLDYWFELGGAERWGGQAEGDASSPNRSCKRALERAVFQIVNHPQVAAALAEND